MNVRAKFECRSVAENDPGTCTTVSLRAVHGDGTDNASWAQATPWGSLDMAITNPAAVAAFTVGTAYCLDIRPLPGTETLPVPLVTQDGTTSGTATAA